MKLLLTVLLACALTLVVQSQFAEAHASLIRSEPPANSTLDTSPDRITIWFSEPMEAAFSEIQVLNATGARVDNKNSAVDANDLTVMSVSLPPFPTAPTRSHGATCQLLTATRCAARSSSPWESLFPKRQRRRLPMSHSWDPPKSRTFAGLYYSARSRSPARSYSSFSSPLPCLWQPARSPLGRLRPRLRSRSQRLLWLALIMFLLASVAQLITQTAIAFDLEPAAAAGPPALELLQETEWGRIWQYRAGLAVLTGVLFLLPLVIRFRRSGRQDVLLSTTLWLALIASLGILATISMTSHAAATIGIARYALVNDVVHLTAAAIWVGGLMQLIANTPLFIHGISENARRNALWRLVRRFSVAAGLSVVVLIATGVYSAWAQVTDFAALDTPYGGAMMQRCWHLRCCC